MTARFQESYQFTNAEELRNFLNQFKATDLSVINFLTGDGDTASYLNLTHTERSLSDGSSVTDWAVTTGGARDDSLDNHPFKNLISVIEESAPGSFPDHEREAADIGLPRKSRAVHNAAGLKVGTVAHNGTGWTFLPTFQATASRKSWPTPEAAVLKRFPNFVIEPASEGGAA